MPKIPDEVVRRVLDRAKIEDVVGDFVTLRRAGVNMTGICPFHDDQHDGNFIVRPSSIPEARHGNTYRCFVCDAKGGPVQFLMAHERLSFPDAIRWLGKKYNEPVDDIPLNYTPPPPKPAPPPLPRLELPRSWVRRTMELAVPEKILFLYWFNLLPWSEEQRARIRETLWTYCVGGWRDGRVVFWQIDHDGVPRAAKLMKYLPDGHRDKERHPGWIYNQEGCREACDPDNHEILKPLFGAHLLKRYPDAVVNIVESEKTALVMANFYGQLDRQLWIACGGLKHLHLESMQPLIDQGRKVWLWPDKDGVHEWQQVADKLGSEKVQVYTRFFDTCWRECDGDKADCADIIIRMMTRGDEARDTGDPQPPTGVGNGGSAAATPDTQTIAGIECEVVEWNTDEPFLDPIEYIDPRLRWARERMSRIHSSGWGKQIR
jgi:hypothetical protein